MKKFSILLFFIFLMRFTGMAHETGTEFKDRFYLRAGGGFGIGLCYYNPCDYYDEEYYPTYDNYKALNFVPGRGFNVDVGAGYMFTKNLGAVYKF